MQADRLPTVDELDALVEARAGAPSAAARLRVATELGRELSELGDALIGRHVTEARDAGLSWTEIGQLFGISKQAAQQRYAATLAGPGVWPGPGSPSARFALDRAREEAVRLGHDYIGTEHVLLALASSEHGLAAEILAGLGAGPERILATRCMQPRPRELEPRAAAAVMPRLKRALEHASRIADGLGSPTADTGHLLAGIVAVPDSMAVEILRRLKVSPDSVRSALADRLGVDPQRLGAPRRRRRLRAGTR